MYFKEFKVNVLIFLETSIQRYCIFDFLIKKTYAYVIMYVPECREKETRRTLGNLCESLRENYQNPVIIRPVLKLVIFVEFHKFQVQPMYFPDLMCYVLVSTSHEHTICFKITVLFFIYLVA